MSPINANWQRILKWSLVLIVLGFAAHTGRLIHARFAVQEVRVGGPIPYAVILREFVHSPNGTTSEGADIIRAVRSDGSIVVQYAHKTGNKTTERIVQFASGTEVTINELANTKSTTEERSINPARWQRDPNSKCINSFAGKPMTSLQEVISGEEMVDGYRTVKIIAQNVTSWYALDYGCAVIKDRAYWGSQGFSEHNQVTLIPGEPAAALFHVPENAKEVPPSERVLSSVKDRASSLEKCGSRCTEIFRKLDARYYDRRAGK